MNDINIDDMKKMDPAQYLALDIRDDISYMHGHVPGAVNFTTAEIEQSGDMELIDGLCDFLKDME